MWVVICVYIHSLSLPLPPHPPPTPPTHPHTSGSWLHGEAVAAGMVMAADLSTREGWVEEGLRDRIVALLTQAKLPIVPPAVCDVGGCMWMWMLMLMCCIYTYTYTYTIILLLHHIQTPYTSPYTSPYTRVCKRLISSASWQWIKKYWMGSCG